MPRRFCLEGGTLLRKTRHAPAVDESESATRGSAKPSEGEKDKVLVDAPPQAGCSPVG